jgi:hypothetical protein
MRHFVGRTSSSVRVKDLGKRRTRTSVVHLNQASVNYHMTSRRYSLSLVTAMICLLSGLNLFADPPPTFKLTTKRDTDKVVVSVVKQKTLFDIHSPFGISQAVIERTAAEWPESMVLRLHLTGLESFQIQSGDATLHASVSSQGGDKPVRLWKNEAEDKPLDSTSPLWTEIRMIGSDGKPSKTIPLQDGYFEIEIPKALREGNPPSITVSWVDFYRN